MGSNNDMTHTETPEATYDFAEAIEPHLTSTPQTPSALARKAKITTGAAHVGLKWMVRNDFAIAEGNGAWTKYRTRRFGERNG